MQCNIEGESHHIKQQWNEFTYAEYCAAVKAIELPPMERLAVFTGINSDTLAKATCAQLSVLFEAVAWMESYEDALLFTKPYSDDLNIGARTYGELEQAKLHMQVQALPALAFGGMLKVYYGEDVSGLNCLEVLAKGGYLLGKIADFLDGFKEIYEYEPTREEVEAGIDELAKLGAFYTVKKMSEKFSKHPDEILNWQAAVVYQFLKADAIDAKINGNLQKIYARKK